MPVAECTVVFYAFTNFGITSIYLRVLIGKVIVDLILDRPVRPFHDRVFHVGILAHLKLDDLNKSRKVLFTNFLPLSVLTQMRRRWRRGSPKTDWNAAVTAVPVLDFSGIM